MNLIIEYMNQGLNWLEITSKINEQRPYRCSLQNYYLQYWRHMKHLTPDHDLSKHREKQLSEIQMLKDELFDSWAKSKGLVKKTTTKGVMNDKGGDGDGLTRKEKMVQEWKEAGEASYLAQYIRLLERESKLLGMDSPEQHKITQTTEHKFSNLSTEEKRELLKLMRKSKDGGDD